MRLGFFFLVGLVFGLGLCVSAMTEPSKVLGFLDLAGRWDPSLAFVMGGGVAVGAVVFRWARRRESALLGDPMPAPPSPRIDRPLILGAALFGIGWGLSGICPGPAIVDAGFLSSGAFIFLAAAGIGMVAFDALSRPGAFAPKLAQDG